MKNDPKCKYIVTEQDEELILKAIDSPANVKEFYMAVGCELVSTGGCIYIYFFHFWTGQNTFFSLFGRARTRFSLFGRARTHFFPFRTGQNRTGDTRVIFRTPAFYIFILFISLSPWAIWLTHFSVFLVILAIFWFIKIGEIFWGKLDEPLILLARPYIRPIVLADF